MDSGEDERVRARGHGLELNARIRIALLLLAATALVSGLAGGLLRLGLPIPLPSAAAFHGAVMVSGFLGTVISLERAVALGGRLAYAAPFASGAGTILLLAGFYREALVLWIVAPLLLFAASVAIARRQPALHTVLLAVAAVAWAVGSLLLATGFASAAPAWWFAFLVLTIAAERLELTRLARRPPAAARLLVALAVLLLLAAFATIPGGRWGPLAYGIVLCAIAAWLAVFDIARHTLATGGFARYAAIALLGGYAWLAVAGGAWALAPMDRDVALHALGLGFVFSMILAHAPLIVPVVLRRSPRFQPFFYVPLALLHASLVLRLATGGVDPAMRALGGMLNAAAIALFIAAVAFAVIRSRPTGSTVPPASLPGDEPCSQPPARSRA